MNQVNYHENRKCKIGFIGYGSMGKMLLNSFISSGKVSPEDIIVSTRTRSKLETVKTEWTGINIALSNIEVAQSARYIFICVKPNDVKMVLEDIKDSIKCESHIISIAGTIKIANIESIVKGQVSKLTPTLASEVSEGVSLLCHGKKVTQENASFIEFLLRQTNDVRILDENDFEVMAEITSCGPGLFSVMVQELANSAARVAGNIDMDVIEEALLRTLLGTLKLRLDKSLTLKEIVERVATKGGITEEGIVVLRQELPQIFDNMFLQMLAKRKKVEMTVNSGYEL